MAANLLALLPVPLPLLAWAGLPGRAPASAAAGTEAGAPCFCLPTGRALGGADAISYARLGEGAAVRSPARLRGGPGTESPSRPGIAGHVVAGCLAADGWAPVKHAGVCEGRQKLRCSLTAFGKIPGGLGTGRRTDAGRVVRVRPRNHGEGLTEALSFR